MKRKGHLFIALCLASILVFSLASAACQITSKEKTPYYIGGTFSLTGPYAPIGVDGKLGMEMAISEINAAGGIRGRQLVGIYYDDESLPPRAVDIFRKLKDQNVLAVLGGTGAAQAGVVGPVANTEKVSFFPHTPVPMPLEKVPGSYYFGPFLVDLGLDMDFWAKHAMAQGTKRMAAIITADPVGDFYDNVLKGLVQKNPGLELVGVERMLPTDTDVTTQLTKLRALRPDVLIVGPSGRPATVVYKGLDLMDWNISAPTTPANVQTSFIDSVKGFSKRVTIFMTGPGLRPETIPLDAPGRPQELRKMSTDFQKKNNKILYQGIISTYDTVNSLADVLDKSNIDPDKQSLQEMRDKIRDGLEQQNFQAVMYLIQRTPQDHRGISAFRSYLGKIEGDWFVPIRWMDYPSLKSGGPK